ncbi:MAG TPA: YceH family protein [Gemmatimonadaceae bacterium]|nr:YceH family protein [Gemmatimonadaceae bacterium]
MQISAIPLRILGALLEKEATTPDVYPLSLNALTAACNQLSNRDPVMSLTEIDVRNAVNALRQEGLVRAIQPAGSKVMKFQHLLTDKLNLDDRERAVLGVLMLRGPQTLGEIRTRTSRLAEFPALSDVESTLTELSKRDLVAEMARRPGQKETRFVQLLGGPPAESAADASEDDLHAEHAEHAEHAGGDEARRPDRVAALEASVDELRRELDELRSRFEHFQRQFG